MKILFDMTLYLSVTAIIILLIKRVFKEKMSKKLQLYVWLILLVRFFVPTLPESKISLYNVVPEVAYQQTAEVVIETITPAVIRENSSRINYLSLAWIGISLLLFGYFLAVYIGYSRKIKKMPMITDKKIIDILNQVKNELGVTREIKLISGDDTPMLKGFLRPAIILPDIYNTDEIRDVFYHELCHLKHGDVFIIWLSAIMLSVNWFNPIMWYAFFTIRCDIELACDERVINYTENRKEYAKLLLKTSLMKNRFILGTTSLQNGEKEISKRIKFIAGFKKPKVYISIIAAAIVLVVSGICLTNAVNKNSAVDKNKEFSLYDLKTEHIGNAYRVGEILKALPYHVGKTPLTMELLTENPPYGIIINFEVKDGFSADKLVKDANLMFGLIDNLDIVEFRHSDTEYAAFSREAENTRYSKEIAEYSKTKEGFDEFFELVKNIQAMVPQSEIALADPIYETTLTITEGVINKMKSYREYDRLQAGDKKLELYDYLNKTVSIFIIAGFPEGLASIQVFHDGTVVFAASVDNSSVDEIIEAIENFKGMTKRSPAEEKASPGNPTLVPDEKPMKKPALEAESPVLVVTE